MNVSRVGSLAAAAIYVPGLILGLAAVANPARVQAAGGAYVVEDVGIAAPGSCKVESWISSASNHDLIGVASPSCVFDLGHPIKIGTQFTRSRADGVWDTSFALSGKTTLVPVENHIFGVGLVGGVSYDITKGQTSTAFFTVPFTFQLAEPLTLNLNVGRQWDLVNDRGFLTWGAGFEYSLTKQVTLIAEVFSVPSPSTNKPGVQAGIRFTPVERVDFDVIYGHNLTGEEADWITLGVNLRF